MDEKHSLIGEQWGNYRLLSRLGRGGFAEVYLGEHLYLHTQVAVKILHASLGPGEEESFSREAQMIAHLRHPHIIQVLDFGFQQNIPFLIMSYARQGNLRARYPKGTRLPLSLVTLYTEQLSHALHYAHAQRLVHRDIKPENILLDQLDQLLLSDFGIALVAETFATENRQRSIAGTIPYMAPELMQGRVHTGSDQYSLAVMIYEWLTGSRPFEGTAQQITMQHLYTEPPSLLSKVPDLPPGLDFVMLKALAKHPEDRYPTVLDFAWALKQVIEVDAREATPILPPDLTPTNTLTSNPAVAAPAINLLNSQSQMYTSQKDFRQIAPHDQSAEARIDSNGSSFAHNAKKTSWTDQLFHSQNLALTPYRHWPFILIGVLSLLLVVAIVTNLVRSNGMGLASPSSAHNPPPGHPSTQIVASPTAPHTLTPTPAIVSGITAQPTTETNPEITSLMNLSPEALYTSVTQGEPVYSSPLNNDDGNWNLLSGSLGSCTFADGSLISGSTINNRYTFCTLKKNDYRNIAIQAQITITSGDAAGFILRSNQGSNNAYTLSYCSNAATTCTLGHVGFFIERNGLSKQLAEFSVNDLLKTDLGATNTITIVALRDTFTLYINGKTIGQVTDNLYSTGTAGVLAYRSTQPTSVSTNTIKIWALP